MWILLAAAVVVVVLMVVEGRAVLVSVALLMAMTMEATKAMAMIESVSPT